MAFSGGTDKWQTPFELVLLALILDVSFLAYRIKVSYKHRLMKSNLPILPTHCDLFKLESPE